MRRWIIPALVVLAVAGTLYAGTAGNLDDDFGADGVVATDFAEGLNDYPFGVVTQADGKIVVVGGARFSGMTNDEAIQGDDRFTVARYNLDGSLDTDFDEDGWTTIALGDEVNGLDEPGLAIDVALDADGKILVVGTLTDLTTRTVTTGKGKNQSTETTTLRDGTRIAVVRLDTDGSLDTTFGGGDGIVLTGISGCDDERPSAIAILANGDILVAGQGTFASASSGGSKKGRKSSGSISGAALLIRYDSDGDLVSGFGEGGVVVDNPTSANDAVVLHGMGIQATEGRIVVLNFDNTVRAFDLATGEPDDQFGTSGSCAAPAGDGWTRLAIDPDDDDILVCGGRASEGYNDGLVTRISTGGTIVSSYAVDLGMNSGFNAIGIDAGGRVLAGGNASGGVYVLRLDGGSPDLTFGPNGISEGTDESSLPSATEGVLDLAVDGADVVLVGWRGRTVVIDEVATDIMEWFTARYCGTTAVGTSGAN